MKAYLRKLFPTVLALGLTFTSISAAFASGTVVVGQRPYLYGPYYGYTPYAGYVPGYYPTYPYSNYTNPNPVLQNPYGVGNPFYLNRYVGGDLRPAREILNAPNPVYYDDSVYLY